MSEAFRAELATQSLILPSNDPRIAAFSQAFLQIIDQPQPAMLEAELDKRANVVPSYAANLLLRSMQKQLLRSDTAYPYPHTTESAWHESFRYLFDDAERFSELLTDVREREVQSNVVERYKAFKLVTSLLHDRLGEELTILDVGCSRNHGLKKLKQELPFRPVTCGIRDTERLPSILLDTLLNGALKQSLHLGHCVGTDKVPLADGDDAFWAKSCSFYPSELLNEAAVAEYDYLDLNEVHGVSFVQGDFTAQGFAAAPATEKFDIITASTFLYQLSEEQRRRARGLFRDHLADNGVIVYQDFVRQSPDERNLQFESNWFLTLFPYRTLIEFGNDPSGRLYEIFRWNSGRCEQWIPGKDMNAALAESVFTNCI